MMWGAGGWWVLGVLVMAACIFMMGRMMTGHGGSKHTGHGGSDHDEGTRSAKEILAERYARGEISQEEFEQRRGVLEGSGDRPHAAA